MAGRARELVDAHEASVAPEDRRARGVHYTPSALADLLVGRAVDHLGRVPTRLCDPACGSGAFLLAAAGELHRRGVPVRDVLTSRLVGIELDESAARVARRALVLWAEELGVAVAEHEVHVEHGDALAAPGTSAAVERPVGVDAVVGNPPFLNQLGERTARGSDHRAPAQRLLGRPGGYADSASLFLVAALDLLDGDGVVCLLQPQSFLATRDCEPVRAAVRDPRRPRRAVGERRLALRRQRPGVRAGAHHRTDAVRCPATGAGQLGPARSGVSGSQLAAGVA